MKDVFPVLGVDVGGTKIAVALGLSDGTLVDSARIASAERRPEDVMDSVIEAANRILTDNSISLDLVEAVGIGAPGPMDMDAGTITPANMKGWVDYPIRDFVSEAFGKKTFFDNDANAGVLAEWFFGAARSKSDVIYLTLSTGIGGGIIANGRLVRGATGLAGEIGHAVLDPEGPICSCGLRGCYEAFCGGRAVAERLKKELADRPEHAVVRNAGGVDRIHFQCLTEAVRDGDPDSMKFWEDICLRHAQAMGMVINTFNPEMIVLGTIANSAGDLLLDPIKEFLPRFCWDISLAPLELKTASLGMKTGEYSGICVGLNGLYEEGGWELPWEG